MRKPLLAANWKMYKTVPQALSYFEALEESLRDLKGFEDALEVAICPTDVALWPLFQRCSASTSIRLGAQNLELGTEGALTGGVSGYLLRQAGAEFVIVGHSERRKHFGETDAIVQEKMAAALEAGLRPILCVGESAEERHREETLLVIHRQVRQALRSLKPAQWSAVTIAYEPVWAIGSGLVPTPQEVERVAAAVRNDLADLAGAGLEDSLRVLYGGSVNDQNLLSFLDMPDVDGALIGGAALNAENLAKMIRCVLDGVRQR